ncbi:MAG TPA: GntG family PLP-dependent aldolase [Planctomycetota bacterium]|nr:GntG family PLP-dependent aldolase [Planctomycetota bacterium]
MTGACDFRSDTVTRPSPAMREAMARAEVGDDVFGDDPTARALEEEGARVLGKEAALFCPTGVMANQIAVRVQTRRGDEVMLHEGCHVYRWEQGGLAALHGIQARALQGPRGAVPVAAFEAEIRPDDQHYPRTSLIVLENTFNYGGGCTLAPDYVAEVGALAKRRGLKLHLDGARLWNAAVATGSTPAALAAPCDTVALCLSKALGAPAGTLLAGPAAFIAEARRARKLLGGGMRQVGVLCAAGLVALREGPAALPADHARARRVAAFLSELPEFDVIPPETNIVVATHPRADDVIGALAARGVRVVGFGRGRLRVTLHRDVDDADVARLEEAFRATAAARHA